MAIDYIVERGELNLHASYSQPLFAMWRDTDALFQHLFSHLAKHGLHLTDLRWNQPGSVGDVQLNFYLLNYTVGVRLRIDRIEVEVLDLRKVNVEQLESAIIDLVGAVQAHKPEISFNAYSISVAYHGKLGAQTATEFTGTLTVAPATLGPQQGAGAVFYYGPEEGRTSAAVTADLSAVVPDGLFFRTLVVWDASQVALSELKVRTNQYVERVLDRFGLNATQVQG